MAYVEDYHDGKGNYENRTYILSKETGEILKTDVQSILSNGNRAFGFEFELEIDSDDYADYDNPDAQEYIMVDSDDYGRIEVYNPNYSEDAMTGVDYDRVASDMEGCLNRPYDKMVHYEHDGSLDCGIEMITQPMTKNAMKKWLDCSGFEDVLNMANTDADSCGCHLHVSKLPDDDVLKMAYIVAYMRDDIHSYIRQSGYAEIWSMSHDNPTYFVNRLFSENLVRRSYALADDGNDGATIEFRLFAMTDDIDRYKQYLDFATQVIDLSYELSWEQIINSRFTLNEDTLEITVTPTDTDFSFDNDLLKKIAFSKPIGKRVKINMNDLTRLITLSTRIGIYYDSYAQTHEIVMNRLFNNDISNEFTVTGDIGRLNRMDELGKFLNIKHDALGGTIRMPLVLLEVIE